MCYTLIVSHSTCVKISKKTTSDFYIAFECFTTYNFENSYMLSE